MTADGEVGMESDRLRARLVRQLRAAADLNREDIASAFLAVPRELFLPEFDLSTVYTDEALVTKRDADGHPISSSSQPAIMAKMLEQLDIRPGQRVLEIGAGTGYNAALMAKLTGDGERVITVDIDSDVVARATTSLAAAGYRNVRAISADGAEGYPAQAPYDRIIATVGVWDISPAWLEQLAPDGRMVLPLDLGGVQRSVAFERRGDHLVSTSVVDCGFMRIRGPAAGPDETRLLDKEAGRTLVVHGGQDADELARALATEPVEVNTTVTASAKDVYASLMLWLSGAGFARVDVYESNAAQPSLLGRTHVEFNRLRLAPGIGRADSVALLVRYRHGSRLIVRAFGPSAGELADELVEQVREWDLAARPATAGMTIYAYPIDACPADAGEAVAGRVVFKRNTKLVLSWPG
jgi:protein-L-isoaspartate(D-aspartate) O-methyltransferase